MSDARSLIRRRGGHRAICTRAINEAKVLMQTVHALSEQNLDRDIEVINQLKCKITLLESQRNLIDKLNEQIADLIEGESELGADMFESAQIWEQIEIFLSSCRGFLQSLDRPTGQGSTRPSVSLPKLNLPIFGGNSLEWANFWEIFDKSIHNNGAISKAEKFSYLKGQLKGQAWELLSGFSISEVFYDEAVKLLIDTYGDPRVLIQAHLEGLFDLKGPSTNSSELIRFRAEYENHIRSLIGLKTRVIESGFIIVALLLRKLPNKIVDNINRVNNSPYWELDAFRNAITNEIQLLQTLETKGQGSQVVKITNKVNFADQPKNANWDSRHAYSKNAIFKPKSTCNFNINSNNSAKASNEDCKFCFEQHNSSVCTRYTSAKAKSDRARELNLCHICLVNNHRSLNCRSKQMCGRCGGRHNALLCFKGDKLKVDKRLSLLSPSGTCSSTGNAGVALPTGILPLEGNGQIIYVRALFDQGSQKTFMLKRVAYELKLKPFKRMKLAIGSFNLQGKFKFYDLVEFNIRGFRRSIRVEAVLVEDLPERINVPGICLAVNKLKDFNLSLADPNIQSDNIDHISVLIGGDYYFDFVLGIDRIEGLNTLRSEIGYMIAGNVSFDRNDSLCTLTSLVMNLADSSHSSSDDYKHSIENLWKLDLIGIDNKALSNDDCDAMRLFKDKICFINGHYEACLPWKMDKPHLPRGYNLAKSRLYSNVHKLIQCGNLKNYDTLIKEQLNLGFIEEVNDSKSRIVNAPIHYLPHHGVNKNSLTTPLRIVFDCSAGRPSLNDCLYSGPSLVNELTQILLRFRLNKYAVIGDIAKAYHMIGLNVDDRNATRFLWLRNPLADNSDIVEYRFKVVLFGATCSQFILLATINHHLDNCNEDFKGLIKRNLYIDNVQITSNSQETLKKLYERVKNHFAHAGFMLREWVSNSSDINNVFVSNGDISRNINNYIKVLGVFWDKVDDNLFLDVELPTITPYTKRNVASIAAKIFDPLGFVSPIIIRAKIFLQELWKLKLDWDTPIPADLHQKWDRVYQDFVEIDRYIVPRIITCTGVVDLHAFSDASSKAYGAVIYAVDQSVARFVMSKSRVAPIKALTIPQLELTACTIAARLLVYIMNTFDKELNIRSINIWCDSQVTICWIKSKGTLKPYVKNRVDEIHSILPKFNLNYVNTKENPADFISRGVATSFLINSKLWLNGPDWLTDPHYIAAALTSNDNFEQIFIPNVDNGLERSTFVPLMKYVNYSSFQRIIKVFALVLRFISLLKNKGHSYQVSLSTSSDHKLTNDEMYLAKNELVKQVQRECFQTEFAQLSSNSANDRSNLVTQLNLFIYEGLLRCRGRFTFLETAFDSKCPILLPSRHRFTDLIIIKIHEDVGHFGVNYVMSEIRNSWYIPRMRQNVKRVLKNCMICRRLQSKPFLPPPVAPLPRSRVTECRPFSSIGIDYTGALLVKENGKTNKVYICLFTCAVTRAVHLELVNGLTCQAFLLAFRRFVGRRAMPNMIYSDNATYFVAAISYFKKCHASDAKLIKWHTIPSRASWYGGFWERLIGMTKNVIRKVLGRSYLKSDELNTLIIEIEMILNNRPLTYVSDAPDDCNAISPSELLTGHKLVPQQEEDFDSDEEFNIDRPIITARYKRQKLLLNHFWQRWQKEYLGALRIRHAWSSGKTNNCQNNLNLGDVVQIFDRCSRLTWKLGIIKKLHVGKDNYVRSVTLMTNHGLLTRPIVQLYPLELHTDILSKEELSSVKDAANVASRPKRSAALRAEENFRGQLA